MKHTRHQHRLWHTCAVAGAVLMIIALLPSAQAQSVTVTGEVNGSIQGQADVSALVERIDGLQSQIDELRERIDTGPDETPPPETPEPNPGPSNGKIGMNAGFVWRSNFTHPDRPGVDNYDDLLRPVCSVYRPMNWNRINDFRPEVDSIDDPHYYDGRTWRDALREQVGLCNAVGAGFYLNVPVRATPGFVREAVAFIRANLQDNSGGGGGGGGGDSGGVIYIAWANEAWLPGRFPYDYLKDVSGTDPGSGDNAFFDLWADKLVMTFAAAREADPTCIRVVETKTARDGTWYTEQIVKRLQLRGCDYDAVAGTLYFSPKWPSGYWESMSVDDAFDEAEEEWVSDDRKWQVANIRWAKDRGKLAIAYEAGQHFHDIGMRPALVRTLQNCQTDPRMGEMYRAVYGYALEAGIDLIIDFDWLDWSNQHGYWGKATSLEELPGSVKYQAVKQIATSY
ncbi:MAG: hypothetical protein R3C45_21105 [Phycisphaerales bacterium]